MPKQKRKKQGRRPLTDQQKQAAWYLFNGESISGTAALVGVHRCTIWRWYDRPDFQKEIARIHDKYVRDRRRQWLKEYHQSPEYKRQQSRKYYARKKLNKLSEQLENARTIAEHERLWKEYEKTYNDAYFGGRTAAEVLSLSFKSYAVKKPRKEPKYIVEIL